MKKGFWKVIMDLFLFYKIRYQLFFVFHSGVKYKHIYYLMWVQRKNNSIKYIVCEVLFFSILFVIKMFFTPISNFIIIIVMSILH